MTMRFVNLTYRNGPPVCAAFPVSIDRRNYVPSDIEFEEAAVRSALQDGLIVRRGDVVAAVRSGRLS